MSLDHPHVPHRHRHDRNRFRSRADEIKKHTPVAVRIPPLSEPGFCGWIDVVAQVHEDLPFHRFALLQAEPFSANANPTPDLNLVLRVVVVVA